MAFSYELDPVLAEQDAVMILRIQFERGTGAYIPGQGEYIRHYQLNAARLGRCKPGVAVMHPGPINRGIELASNVADSDKSVILDQVTNGVAVRMAVLFLLGGGENV